MEDVRFLQEIVSVWILLISSYETIHENRNLHHEKTPRSRSVFRESAV